MSAHAARPLAGVGNALGLTTGLFWALTTVVIRSTAVLSILSLALALVAVGIALVNRRSRMAPTAAQGTGNAQP